ncbi:extracellular solute-binding protein [Hungatella hathewayi]|uniref:extracellular solute-binding protein n=1 Tax=Hungatella hathewayi TaxID=154046 RepID=UPI003566702C
MKKRSLAAILAASMLMTACGSASTSQGEKTKENEPERALVENYVPAYPIVEEPITVTGLVVGRDLSVSKDRLVWEKVEEVTGVNIEWINIDLESLSTYLAGNDWPDFFHTDELTSSQVNDYGVVGGKFVNYLDYLDIMPNLAKTYEDFPEALATSTQLNGEVYNLFQVGGPTSTGTTARPHVRLDVLKEAGITEMPKTVEEFYDQLVTLKEKNGEPGLILDVRFDTGMVPMLFAAFGPLHNLNMDNDGTGKVVYSRVTEQMKHYYEFLNKLYKENLMNREWLTLDNTALDQLAKAGKVAYPTASSVQKLSKDDLNGNWDNLGTMTPLTSEYDSTQTLAGRVDYRAVAGMYINKESEYVEELCKMFDIAFATEEVVEGSGLYGQTFTWGFENTDWVLHDDNTYDQIVPEQFGSFSEYQEQLLRWKDFGRADTFGSAVTSTEGNSQARQKGYVKNVIPYQLTENIFPAEPLGILKFSEDEQYVIDNKYADITLYVDEMQAKFITGVSDLNTEWDKYVATCEQMGLNEVLEVYQASYDRWQAAVNGAN